MISADMTIARLFEEHPELVEVLAEYHPHFQQFRNRLLRRVVAPRVTLAQVANIASVPLDDLVSALRAAVGEAAPSTRRAATASASAAGSVVELDVRGLEPPQPMVRILEAVERMRAEDRLVVLHERRPTFL